MSDIKKRKLNLVSLTWPIFVEILLFMLLGSVDTLMLGKYSDNAVAAVGVSNQLIGMMNILFGVLSTGTAILVAQNLGANNRDMASKVTVVSLMLNFFVGLILSGAMYFGSEPLLRLMNIRIDLIGYGKDYLGIVGGFLFLQSVLMTITAVVRNHGYTKISMYVTLGMNILHVILDYAFIFGPFGIPVLGVKGVAISTNICKLLGLAVMLYILLTRVEKKLTLSHIRPFPKDVLKDLLKIGIPTAGEQLSYNLSQIVVTFFINMLSNEALTTRAYVQNIIMFSYLFAVAIGQGTEILVGHLVGEGRKERAYKACLKSLKIAMIVSVSMAAIFAIFRTQLFSIFTENKSIIYTGGIILIIDVLLEPGRAFNLVVINSLRAAGDVRFPVYMGILSMWGVSVVLSYILGIHFGIGIIGMWIAFTCDEWLRGLLMLWRWRSKKWESMSFIKVKTS